MISNIFNLWSFIIILTCISLSLTSSNILMLWVLIEVCGFSLIYSFIEANDNSNISFSSFVFYLFNGISSILIVSGCYLNCSLLTEFGILSKFFIFPFSVALFYIFNNVNWLLIFIIGSVFKVFLLSLSFIVESVVNWHFVYLTLFICVFFILLIEINLKGLWFILNLSSSCILFSCCSFSNNSINFILLTFYLIISCINIYLLSGLDCINDYSLSSNNISVNFLLYSVGFPLSVNLLYKIVSICVLFSLNNVLFLILWCSYIIIETIFMFSFFSSLISNLKSIY